MMRRSVIALCLLLACVPVAARAQGLVPSPAAPAPAAVVDLSGDGEPATLRVFLDCKENTPCYGDYVRTEVDYVDYVNVREAADVHILVTSLWTGAGGRAFTFKFIGLAAFDGFEDEVQFATLPTDTEELARRGFVRTLKLGLVRYALHTGIGAELNVTHKSAGTRLQPAASARARRDPWNYWVFRTRLNANLDSESASESEAYSGSVSANRTTPDWRLNFSGYQDYRENSYTFSDGTSYRGVRRGFDATGQVIKSLTTHWSVGGKAVVAGSTYENKDQVLNASAAVEFNVFPYSESTRRQLTVQYMAGVTNFDYQDETVYGKLEEMVGSHTLRASFDLKQTWGSLSADLDYLQYMHDSSFNRKAAAFEADVRLFKGFALTVYGRTAAIHDQLYLPKGDASDEEVLARQRQLATSFRNSVRVGLSYTFGSIFSSVVNTRLSNLVGGF